MHIGIDARSLGPQKTGVGTYLAEVLNHWREGGLGEVLSLFSHQELAYPNTARTPHRVVPARWGLPWYLFQSHRLLRQQEPSVFWGAQNLLPVQLPRQIPAVVTIHDCVHQFGRRYAPSLLHSWAHRYFLPSAARRARKILVVSRFSAGEVMRCLQVPAAKLEVTPLGVRKEFFSGREGGTREVEAKYQLARPFILGVGTLEPRKNLKTLLRAFALLPVDFRKRYQLVLAGKRGWGNGELSSDLAASAKSSQLRMIGYVSEDDLPALYAAAEMFVFPSFYEGFGLPVLEALAAGCPVIASTAASLKEIAGSAAIFVDPAGPPSEWTRAMVRVAESADLRKALALAGAEEARKFSWEACAGKTAEVVCSAAGT